MGQSLTDPRNAWKDTVDEILSLNSQLNGLAQKTVAIASRIGELLTHVRGAVKHGQWLPWIDQNAPFSRKSADNYIWVFENRDKLVNVANLSEAYHLRLQSNNGDGDHKPQQLHESNFYFHSIRATQRLMGEINHEIKDHPVDSWERDKCQSLAAALEPLAELYQRLKAMIT